ncbi:hypothetical protein RZS08_42665, partial [Arthrospira platensis SPKY1]|nr:hypothetical protein [Arthrospira platensis SPKY1]
MGCAEAFAVDLDRACIDEACETLDDIDSRLVEHAGVDAVEAHNIRVSPALERLPVEVCAIDRETVP